MEWGLGEFIIIGIKEFFVIDEVSTTIKDRYMRHYYHILNVTSKDTTNKALGCGDKCYIQDENFKPNQKNTIKRQHINKKK